jgi:hypothetical protein
MVWHSKCGGAGAGGYVRESGRALVVVAVALDDCPPEGAPLVDERLQPQGFGHRRQALDLVVIHHGDEVIELVVAGEKDGFPVRPFIALAVAEQHEHAMRGAIALRAQCHSRPDRQAVAQRAGRELDARDAVV